MRAIQRPGALRTEAPPPCLVYMTQALSAHIWSIEGQSGLVSVAPISPAGPTSPTVAGASGSADLAAELQWLLAATRLQAAVKLGGAAVTAATEQEDDNAVGKQYARPNTSSSAGALPEEVVAVLASSELTPADLEPCLSSLSSQPNR